MTLVNKILNFKVVDGRLVRYGKQLEAEEKLSGLFESSSLQLHQLPLPSSIIVAGARL